MAKVKVYRTSGPSSYSTGGFTFDATDFKKVNRALVGIENDSAGNYHVEWSVSGNTITIKVSTISADTSTGAISATEVSDGTDLSSLYFDIVVEGV